MPDWAHCACRNRLVAKASPDGHCSADGGFLAFETVPFNVTRPERPGGPERSLNPYPPVDLMRPSRSIRRSPDRLGPSVALLPPEAPMRDEALVGGDPRTR